MLNQERDFDEVPRKWTAVRVDVTGHCGEEFVARCGGKVYEVCLYDANERTYCCEVTPSYCLYPVDLTAGSLPEEDAARERLFEELLDARHELEDVCYMHCSDVDRLPEEDKVEQEGLERDAPFDDVHEHYHQCPDF